ncbi:sterol desaturase/sphingolipid hydroxylase (fatty acid hydroxylase superfamily) [Idiomarina aquatica]|uniref:Sterol desaturase/sphingolipid hydroxylase (Fatty acid hydroxylase superfamily) n=1 Tax=Idiomarina aquatica TaxID=1327752 RepID=A0A4R6PQN7_9GAMM|nr:sterol desaturase family protein [Idiomarina aquatica]TDP40314.1 sterol desaturase/sphingolipid hydroxylase (fatty acid hydroxylase superfamily) [Idiomarina aquatica]
MTMEAIIRLTIFLSVLALMVGWEVARPKRQPRYNRWQRWPANLGIVVIDTLVTRLLVPAGVVGAALWAQQQGVGLFNMLQVPAWLAVVASFILLDIAIYWQHRAFHRIPVLWRLHRVHHADPDFDVTTGLRFHPIEIVLSLGIKAAVAVVLGAPVLAIIIFEVVLNACSLFNHGNVALPPKLERAVRKILITQELHRIHHSSVKTETNSNYGFSVSWWDHLFNSYTGQPQAGSDNVDIGLTDYRDASLTTKLWGLLRIPFR